MKEHILMVVAVLVMVFVTAEGHAQSTTLKLPTSDSASNFAVLDSGNNTLFNVRADGNITNTLGSGGSFLVNSPGGAHLTLHQSTGKMGVGNNVTNPRAQLEVGGYNGILSTGAIGSGDVLAPGAGPRFMWYPRTGAFRAGVAESNYWDDDGTANTKLANYSVAMGYYTRASAPYAVAIGRQTYATGQNSLALGNNVQATANNAVAIGYDSWATGPNSMVLGQGLSSNGYEGSVLIGDNTPFARAYASNMNQLTMRFCGGTALDDHSMYDGGGQKAYRFLTTHADTMYGVYMNRNSSGWSNYSSRDLKENFRPLDGEEVLGRIRNMSVTEWNYKGTPETKYIGPVAEEFWDAFHLNGDDRKGINSISMDGVNMAGIQALESRTGGMKAEMTDMKAESEKRNAALQAEIDQLKAELSALKAQLAALAPRLSAK